MKKKFFEAHKSMVKKLSCLVLAAVIAGTGLITYHNVTSDYQEPPVFVDQGDVEVVEDEVPLASGTKTTKKVTTKTTTKKTNMAKKATKNSTTTKKSTSQKTSTKRTTSQSIKTVTKVETTIKTTTKKNSKVKTTETKVVTTVTTTTTQLATTTASSTSTSSAASSSSSTAAAGTYKIRSVAPKADSRVLNAFERIGCTVVVNPKVSYSGCFDAGKRTITLKTLDSTVYHELGHFVEFVGGTTQVKQKITAAYNAEKSKYTAYNRAYVIQNSSEYFAESFKNYCENPAALKASRPNTYNAIVAALSSITDSRVNTLISVYASVWK